MEFLVKNSGGKKEAPPLRDRLIPWYFVMAFMVVFAVNGVFVYVATRSNSGVVTDNPYKKGIAYNQTLAQARAQETLGWQSVFAYEQDTLIYRLGDKAGKPIDGAQVIAYISRPLTDGYNTIIPLNADAKGGYSAEIRFPLKGQWQVTLHSIWNTHQHQYSKRFVID